MKIFLIAILLVVTLTPYAQSQNDDMAYDAQGRLIRDKLNEIESITWTNDNRIKRITRVETSTQSDLQFIYDSSGKRIAKIVMPRDGHGVQPQQSWIYSYYIYDVAGNIISAYTKTSDNNADREEQLLTKDYQFKYDVSNMIAYATDASEESSTEPDNKHYKGQIHYLLKDHLGSVTTTVTDRRQQHDDDFSAEINHSSDYYPYGATMADRVYHPDERYSGFNGIAFDNTSGYYVTDARSYHPGTARWTTPDPLARKYPALSPYCFGSNNPIAFTDTDGREIKPSPAFLSSHFGLLYKDLVSNNTAYNNMIKQYRDVTDKFSLSLAIDDQKVPANLNALTDTRWIGLNKKPFTIVEATSNQFYTNAALVRTVTEGEYTYGMIRTDIGNVRIIVHEALHSYLGVQGIDEDPNHDTFDASRQMVVAALSEYNIKHSLRYTEEQIDELSYTEGSTPLKNHITELTKRNNTTYDHELQNYRQRIDAMTWVVVTKQKNQPTPIRKE